MSGKNLAGRKFGRLTVLKQSDREDIYICKCACGTEVLLYRSQLVHRIKRHCGCLAGCLTFRITAHTRRIMNGRRNHVLLTPEYYSWRSMLARCYKKYVDNYATYGGRGISVCHRWARRGGKGFQNFLVDMGPRPVGMTLDRISPFKNYFKANCRWATSDIQQWNKRCYWLNGKPPALLSDPLYATHVQVAQDLDAPLF
jgi:hypothetical protein